jgi:hypothetical protein
MNKKGLALAIAVVIGAAVWNVSFSIRSTHLPNVVIQNIEALAEENSSTHNVCGTKGGSCTVIIGSGANSTTTIANGWHTAG